MVRARWVPRGAVVAALLVPVLSLAGGVGSFGQGAAVATGALRALLDPDPWAFPTALIPAPRALPAPRRRAEPAGFAHAERLRAMVDGAAWGRLNTYLATLDRNAARGNPADELRLLSSWRVVVEAGRDNRAAIERWVAATPAAWQAQLALAQYWFARSRAAQGDRAAIDAAAAALQSARAGAGEREPVAAHWLRIALGQRRGDGGAAAAEALRRYPNSYVLSRAAMQAHLPSAGGSLRRMAQFAAERVAAAPNNPAMTRLYGLVWAQHACRLMQSGQARAALAAFERALAHGDSPAVRDCQGEALRSTGRAAAALRAHRRAVALAPLRAAGWRRLAEALVHSAQMAASQRAWARYRWLDAGEQRAWGERVAELGAGDRRW